MIATRFPRLLMVASVVTLAACTVGKAQPVQPNTAPAPLVPTDVSTTTAPAPMMAPETATSSTTPITDRDAAIYARLSRVESDVAGMKDQMGQMAPLLQKMPALQDKLGELVTELQRIDQRVATAQENAATLHPAPTPAPEPTDTVVPAPAHGKMAEMKTASAAPAPVPEPSVKPAPAKGLVTPNSSSSEELLAAKTAPMPTAKPATKVKATAEKPADKKAETKKADVATGKVAVQAVRLGDDAHKTRLVMDLTKKTPFTYDLDNNEKILIVDLDAAAWAAAPSASFAKSPLVASYTAQTVDGGKYRLVIQLKTPVKVQTAQALAPNGEKGDRIVFDLVKAP